MSRSGKYFDQLESTFGKGTVTSGYRSQEEQDALVRRGATRATRSAHTYGDGYDFKSDFASSPQEFHDKLKAQGWEFTRVKHESGKGRNQGTGAHWHAEGVRRVGGPTTPNGTPVNASGPGNGVVNPRAYLDGLQSELAPESKASQNVTQNASAIFGSDGEMKTREAAVETQLQAQSAGIDVLDQATQALQTTQIGEMTQKVADTQAVSNEINRGIQELKTSVKPVFEARGRIADQLDKLNSMNPIERGIRGIFDLNYDRKFLEQQLSHYDQTLNSRAQDFNYINNLHNAALTEIDRRYNTSTAFGALMVDHAKDDLGIVGLRLQQTAGELQSLENSIQNESQLISAKAIAREDLIGRLDSPTVMSLANQAKQSGGVVQFNGVEFSYHELRTRLETDESRALNQEAVRMAIANNRMDLAEGYANNIARSLTREQTEAAIANGGVWNGVQLPQDTLTATLQNHLQRGAMIAQTATQNMPASSALQVASQSLHQITGLYNRSKTMFGDQANTEASAIMNNGSELTRRLIEATKSGQPPEVITALTAQIAANSQAMNALTEKSILTHVGGDAKAAAYMKGFVYGTPMSQGTAVEAITYFAIKGNMPEGMVTSPEAKQIFGMAQSLVNNLQGTRDPRTGKAYTVAGLQTAVAAELGKNAPKAVGQARFNSLYSDLPAVAARVQHPFGRIKPADWQKVTGNAKVSAATAMARQLDTTPQTVLKMVQTGKPYDASPEAKELFTKFTSQAGTFRALEMQETAEGLDDLPQATAGRRNSSVMVDFLNSAQLHNAASAYTAGRGANSMADYMVNPLADGALETRLQQTGQEMQQVQSQMHAAQRQAARNQPYGMLYKPENRSQVILASIPGIGPDGVRSLMPSIQKILQMPTVRDARESAGSTINARMVAEDAAILNGLASMKLEDPQAETYRKVAVRGWQEHSTRTMGMAESILHTFNATLDSNDPIGIVPNAWGQ